MGGTSLMGDCGYLNSTLATREAIWETRVGSACRKEKYNLTLSNISCATPFVRSFVLWQNRHNTVKLRRRPPPAARRQTLTAQFCRL